MNFTSFALVTVALAVCQTTVVRAGKSVSVINYCGVQCAFLKQDVVRLVTFSVFFSCFKRVYSSHSLNGLIVRNKRTLHPLSDTCAPDILPHFFPEKSGDDSTVPNYVNVFWVLLASIPAYLEVYLCSTY